MDRRLLLLGALFGFLGMVAATLSSHVMAARLTAEQLEIFQVAVRYQMYHAVALLAMAGIAQRRSERLLEGAGWVFAAGILLFCGSLYTLAAVELPWLGGVAAMGALLLLLGWLLLASAAVFGWFRDAAAAAGS